MSMVLLSFSISSLMFRRKIWSNNSFIRSTIAESVTQNNFYRRSYLCSCAWTAYNYETIRGLYSVFRQTLSLVHCAECFGKRLNIFSSHCWLISMMCPRCCSARFRLGKFYFILEFISPLYLVNNYRYWTLHTTFENFHSKFKSLNVIYRYRA